MQDKENDTIVISSLEGLTITIVKPSKKVEGIYYSVDHKHELSIEFKCLPCTSLEVQKKAKETLKWLTEGGDYYE